MAIRKGQNSETNFSGFLQNIWDAVVIGYEVDFIARTVNYYGINNESYLEEYPAVELAN